jgi:hypothetical protein
MADRDMASRFAAGIPDPAILRVGRVTQYSAGSITVAISDSEALIDAAYLIGQYQPALGDIVCVVKQGNQWLVLGGLSANPDDNPVLNHSFEDGAVGSMAPNWTLYHDPASTDTTVVATRVAPGSGEIDGAKTLQLELDSIAVGSSFSTDYISSDPIPVVAGERWSASAWVTGFSESGPPWVRGFATVELIWYASPADTYPSYISRDGAGLVITPTTLPWILVRTQGGSTGGFEAPAGATALRVTLGTTLTHEATTNNFYYYVFWDRVIATKLS